MFDKLISLIIDFGESIIPFVVIREYQEGVLLRLGKYRRTLTAGLHFIVPFADHVEHVVTVWTTVTLPVQSVVTHDGKLVVVKGMVKYRVSDARVYTLEAYDANDALSDTGCGAIFNAIHGHTYADCVTLDMASVITAEMKKEARKWGITVKTVTLTDFGEVRSIRLFNEGANIT